MSHDEIFKKVQGVLVDALGVDDDEVTPTARLTTDLHAESIDFLDIVFRIEKAFGFKIGQGELFPDNINDPKYVTDGVVNAARRSCRSARASKPCQGLPSRLPSSPASRYQRTHRADFR